MKISIITICRNNLKGLRRTGSSVISQSCKDYDWIIIDGDSNDGTKQYLDEVRQYTSFCISEPDKGIYDAMNKGIAHAQGDYLLFLNSGDSFIDSNSLQSAVNIFPDKGDVLYADAIYHFENSSKEVIHPEHFNLYHFWIRYCPCHQATFIKRELLLESNGYDSSYRICADYKQWLLWMATGKSFVHLPVTITNYMTDGISSTNLTLHKKEHDRAIRETLTENDIILLHSFDGVVADKDNEIARLRKKVKHKRHLINILLCLLLTALCLLLAIFVVKIE